MIFYFKENASKIEIVDQTPNVITIFTTADTIVPAYMATKKMQKEYVNWKVISTYQGILVKLVLYVKSEDRKVFILFVILCPATLFNDYQTALF